MRRIFKMVAVVGALMAVSRLFQRKERANHAQAWSQAHPGTAVITGASSGIGAAFARALAREGCHLVLLARREARLQSLADEIMRQYPVQVELIVADLNDPALVEQAAQRIAQIRDLDILVNNAGFGLSGSYVETDIESTLSMVRVHILATKHLTWAAIPAMVARGHGAIINLSSVAAFIPDGRATTYGATKAYLNFFSESLAGELRGSGVRVQALCPGFTYTEFHDRFGRPPFPAFMWLTAEEVVSESLKGLKENRLYVIPGRIYQLIVFVMHLPMILPLVRLVRSLMERSRPVQAK